MILLLCSVASGWPCNGHLPRDHCEANYFGRVRLPHKKNCTSTARRAADCMRQSIGDCRNPPRTIEPSLPLKTGTHAELSRRRVGTAHQFEETRKTGARFKRNWWAAPTLRSRSSCSRDAERRLMRVRPDGHWRAIRHQPPLTSQERLPFAAPLLAAYFTMRSRGRSQPSVRRGGSVVCIFALSKSAGSF